MINLKQAIKRRKLLAAAKLAAKNCSKAHEDLKAGLITDQQYIAAVQHKSSIFARAMSMGINCTLIN